ncbi:MAG: dihydroorotate dehydrogenase electron transfer subunit [Deltaproteobacteria bacterium]|nr:dihydroorotate dehydrogenase electron transfer subunit [Deltaproteobacteria bacterium]
MISGKVLYNKKILPLYYKLGMSWEDMPVIEPGQFIMLRINDRIDPLLRRPFGVYSILRAGRKKEGIEIVYKVVGKGTRLMAGLRPGDTVDILGPLGNGFPHPQSSPFAKGGQRGLKIIMVAGGIGVVPFYLLAKNYQKSPVSLKLLFGGRGKDDLPGLKDFKKLRIDMAISTDDGGIGEKGFVTELLKKELKTQSLKLKTVVYACGPKGMLKAVAKTAEDADVPCHVSLDNAMACGMGACLGCAVKVQGQGASLPLQAVSRGGKGREKQNSQLYKMVCKDGPVFDAKEIAWEEV